MNSLKADLRCMGAFWLITGSLLAWASIPAIAQVTPDQTLPNNTTVSSQGDIFTINGGTIRGSNLFHSFSQFSLPTSSTAFFDNDQSIGNIIGRVTGGSASMLDGILRANGTANLFLINPNGITFGPNAQLQIGGSFLGSTANRVLFQDGYQYSSQNPSGSVVLTSSVPVGLGFLNPGKITVLGPGSKLIDSPFGPFVRTGLSSSGLQVQPGRSLALIGGDIALSGGLVSAPSGTAELGSVNGGIVRLSGLSPSWTFDYAGAAGFRDIQLGLKSLVDASGLGGGSIGLQGRNVSFTGGSIALIQNFGTLPDNSIRVTASDSLLLEGIAPDYQSFSGLLSGLYSESLGSARGANLFVAAPQVTLTQGSIGTTTYGEGPGGSINLSALNLSVLGGGVIGASTASSGRGGNNQISADNIVVSGVNPFFPQAFSAILSNARGTGPGGSTTVSGRSLTVSNRGSVGTNTLGPARGGDVTLNLSEQIQIIGGQGDPTPSNLTSSTFGFGTAGSLVVNTPRLLLQDGGLITAATFYRGDAGRIFVNAPEFVQLQGGFIASAAVEPSESIRLLLGIPRELTGAPGSITINTPRLQITDGGAVSVQNNGFGRAGILRVNADFLRLINGSITATTVQGPGGEIEIFSRITQLSNGTISASATGFGEGGNVSADTGVLVGQDNSVISAAAAEDRGGNITIDALGVFFSPDSVITATGGTPQLDGTVEINTPNQDLSRSAQPVPQPEAPEVVMACSPGGNASRSQLVNTRAGGIPPNPTADPLSRNRGWYDDAAPREAAPVTTPRQANPKFQEAQGLRINPDGTMSLVLLSENPIAYGSLAKPSCS